MVRTYVCSVCVRYMHQVYTYMHTSIHTVGVYGTYVCSVCVPYTHQVYPYMHMYVGRYVRSVYVWVRFNTSIHTQTCICRWRALNNIKNIHKYICTHL